MQFGFREAVLVEEFPHQRRLDDDLFHVRGITMPGEEIQRDLMISAVFEKESRIGVVFPRPDVGENGAADLDVREAGLDFFRRDFVQPAILFH